MDVKEVDVTFVPYELVINFYRGRELFGDTSKDKDAIPEESNASDSSEDEEKDEFKAAIDRDAIQISLVKNQNGFNQSRKRQGLAVLDESLNFSGKEDSRQKKSRKSEVIQGNVTQKTETSKENQCRQNTRTPSRRASQVEKVPEQNNSRPVLRRRQPSEQLQRLNAAAANPEESESDDNEDCDSIHSSSSEDDEVQVQVISHINQKKSMDSLSQTPGKSKDKKGKIPQMKELAEEYFRSHTTKRNITSDRTLTKLQTPRMDQVTLQEHLKSVGGTHTKQCSKLFSKYKDNFSKWIFQLRHGFNLLLYGLGSKRRLLDDFRKKMLPESVHIVVNGFFPSITIKQVLSMISEDVLSYSGTFKSIIDHASFLRDEYSSGDNELFLIIHNIDGPTLRNNKTQEALSHLASAAKIHIIASIDHINAPLIWDQNKASRFNWLWNDVTTFDNYSEESSFENSMLVQQSGSLALSSLNHVLKSLTPNARGIFMLLVYHQLDNEKNSSYVGISFSDMYMKCREKFLVNSDLTLRAQLTEFRDHKLIKTKKGPDGIEYLTIPLDSTALNQFLEQSQNL